MSQESIEKRLKGFEDSARKPTIKLSPIGIGAGKPTTRPNLEAQLKKAEEDEVNRIRADLQKTAEESGLNSFLKSELSRIPQTPEERLEQSLLQAELKETRKKLGIESDALFVDPTSKEGRIRSRALATVAAKTGLKLIPGLGSTSFAQSREEIMATRPDLAATPGFEAAATVGELGVEFAAFAAAQTIVGKAALIVGGAELAGAFSASKIGKAVSKLEKAAVKTKVGSEFLKAEQKLLNLKSMPGIYNTLSEITKASISGGIAGAILNPKEDETRLSNSILLGRMFGEAVGAGRALQLARLGVVGKNFLTQPQAFKAPGIVELGAGFGATSFIHTPGSLEERAKAAGLNAGVILGLGGAGKLIKGGFEATTKRFEKKNLEFIEKQLDGTFVNVKARANKIRALSEVDSDLPELMRLIKRSKEIVPSNTLETAQIREMKESLIKAGEKPNTVNEFIRFVKAQKITPDIKINDIGMGKQYGFEPIAQLNDLGSKNPKLRELIQVAIDQFQTVGSHEALFHEAKNVHDIKITSAESYYNELAKTNPRLKAEIEDGGILTSIIQEAATNPAQIINPIRPKGYPKEMVKKILDLTPEGQQIARFAQQHSRIIGNRRKELGLADRNDFGITISEKGKPATFRTSEAIRFTRSGETKVPLTTNIFDALRFQMDSHLMAEFKRPALKQLDKFSSALKQNKNLSPRGSNPISRVIDSYTDWRFGRKSIEAFAENHPILNEALGLVRKANNSAILTGLDDAIVNSSQRLLDIAKVGPVDYFKARNFGSKNEATIRKLFDNFGVEFRDLTSIDMEIGTIKSQLKLAGVPKDVINSLSDSSLTLWRYIENDNRLGAALSNLFVSLKNEPKLKEELFNPVSKEAYEETLRNPKVKKLMFGVSQAIADTQFQFDSINMPPLLRNPIVGKVLLRYTRFPISMTRFLDQRGEEIWRGLLNKGDKEANQAAISSAKTMARLFTSWGITSYTAGLFGLSLSQEFFFGATVSPIVERGVINPSNFITDPNTQIALSMGATALQMLVGARLGTKEDVKDILTSGVNEISRKSLKSQLPLGDVYARLLNYFDDIENPSISNQSAARLFLFGPRSIEFRSKIETNQYNNFLRSMAQIRERNKKTPRDIRQKQLLLNALQDNLSFIENIDKPKALKKILDSRQKLNDERFILIGEPGNKEFEESLKRLEELDKKPTE